MLLGSRYIPGHAINRMSYEGDVVHAREFYFSKRPGNLSRLLRNRYTWMLPFLEGKKRPSNWGRARDLYGSSFPIRI